MGEKQSQGEMDWVDGPYRPACEQRDYMGHRGSLHKVLL